MERKILNNSFTVLQECTTGFQYHVNLKHHADAKSQLNRRFLFHRFLKDGNPLEIKRIIENNISLRLSFGWGFTSAGCLGKIILDIYDDISSRYSNVKISLVTDLRCDWLGFMPYNIFERSVYENLSTEDLINFNNNICNFQIDIVQSVLNSQMYKNHLLIKDKNYRYDFFKLKRKNKEDLIDGFHYLLESLNELYPYDIYPIQFIEELIGSHFLYYPDTFFELIDFYTLKGKINGRE